MKKNILTTLLLTGSISFNAYGLGSILQLNPVSIAPGQTAVVLFDKFYKDIFHVVTCNIINVSHPDQSMNVIFGLGKESVGSFFYVNGTKMHFGVKYEVKPDAEIVLDWVSSNHEHLAVRNLDYTDTIKIYNCRAKIS